MQKSTSVKTLSKTNDIGFHVAQKQSKRNTVKFSPNSKINIMLG